MLQLSDIVEIQVSVESSGLALPGFGIPLILSANADFSERVRTYASASEVAVDFDLDSPEYLAAAVAFAQTSRVSRLKIGRCANKPTQVFTLSVAAVANSTAYKARVTGQGFTATDITVTSDSSVTNDEIVAALVTALNTVANKNYTAAATGTSGSQIVTITGTAAGDWFAVDSLDLAYLSVTQTHSNPDVVADLEAIAAEDPDFFFILPLYNSTAYLQAIATWCATNERMLVASTNDSIAATQSLSPGTDVLTVIKATNNRFACLAYRRSAASFYASGVASILGASRPGSLTLMHKTIVGETADNLSSTQRANIAAKYASCYETIGGRSIIVDGFVSDGWYADTSRNLAWLKQQVAADLITMLGSVPKLPYTQAGATAVEGSIRATFARAANYQVIGSDYTVTVPDVSLISSSTKQTRILPDVEWTVALLQAIHRVKPIAGKVTF